MGSKHSNGRIKPLGEGQTPGVARKVIGLVRPASLAPSGASVLVRPGIRGAGCPQTGLEP
jgi:hypothetical protein